MHSQLFFNFFINGLLPLPQRFSRYSHPPGPHYCPLTPVLQSHRKDSRTPMPPQNAERRKQNAERSVTDVAKNVSLLIPTSVTFSNISFICNKRVHTRARLPASRCVFGHSSK